MSAKAEKTTIKIFRVNGSFRKGKRHHKFKKEFLTENKEEAKELVYSIMGSKHRVKRRDIAIDNIESISADQVTDPIIKHMIGGN